jgi:hypothetical protein
MNPEDNDTADNEIHDEDLAQVVIDEGEKIAEQTWSCGSWSSVFKYKNSYYAIDEVEMTRFDDARGAFLRANIGKSTYDRISHMSVAPAYRHFISSDENDTG